MAAKRGPERSRSSRVEPASTRWKKLRAGDRRVLRRLSLFAGVFPVDALVALARSPSGGALERLLSSEALRSEPGGFRLAPLISPLAQTMSVTAREAKADLVAFGRWLLEHVASVERSATDTASAFDRLEPLAIDVQRLVGELEPHDPALGAKLWCGAADLLFYRRLLPFDSPEYETAVRCADRAGDPALRVQARLAAARAILEVKSPAEARPHFDRALEIAAKHALDDGRGDALRGLGWVRLAEGDVNAARKDFLAAHALHVSTRNTRGIADACMALGVVDVLLSNASEAGESFFRAEALLRARQDTVRLAKLETLRRTLGLSSESAASTEAEVQDLLSRGQYWRAALLLLRSEEPDAKRRAEILADLAGVSWKDLVASSHAPSFASTEEATPRSWELRCDGLRRLLVGPDGSSHDLTRRGPLARILQVLSESKGALSALSLFEAGWPGETARHEAALLRVYTTVRRLRALGVPIATSGDGYFCDQIRSVR